MTRIIGLFCCYFRVIIRVRQFFRCIADSERLTLCFGTQAHSDSAEKLVIKWIKEMLQIKAFFEIMREAKV